MFSILLSPSFSDLFLRFWDLKTNIFSLDISDKLKRSNMTKITLSDSNGMPDVLVFNFKISEFCSIIEVTSPIYPKYAYTAWMPEK